MSVPPTVLTDADAGTWCESFEVTGAADGFDWSIRKTTIRGGPGDGIDVVEIDNGLLSVSILPTRGMSLWKARCGKLPLEWQSPVARPVHPSLVSQSDHGGLGWLAGFHELLVRCGLGWHGPPGIDRVPLSAGGTVEVPLTLHGRIANTPAHRVETGVDQEGRLWVSGEVDETMLFGPRLRLEATVYSLPGSNRLTVRDRVTNLGGGPAEFELLYHTNLGRPLLEPDARLVAPARRVIPCTDHAATDVAGYDRFAPPVAGYVEQCYFLELAGDDQQQTSVLLHNAAADRGLCLEFSLEQLPCFTLWKNTQAEADGYVAGIEPSTDYPNPREFEREQGRVLTLVPGETWEGRLDLVALVTSEDVAACRGKIAGLLGDREPVLCETRQPGLCPGG